MSIRDFFQKHKKNINVFKLLRSVQLFDPYLSPNYDFHQKKKSENAVFNIDINVS